MKSSAGGEVMAKDDYDYIVFKILTYLYSCLKRQISFNKTVFESVVITKKVQDGYLTDILRMMEEENLIEGLSFVKAWGNEYIISNDIENIRITGAGIRYVLNNDKMKQIKKLILEGTPGAIMELVKIAFEKTL